MRTHLLTRGCGLVAALTLLGAGAHAQFADYTRRVPLTIKNNGVAATPTPTSAEALLPLDNAMRTDHLDLRVGYDNGTSVEEIDSKVFRALVTTPPTLTENQSAGKTDYASLPTGTQLSFAGVDDSSLVVTLPFDFPFVDGTTNKLTIGIDCYAAPGENDPGRNDNADGSKSARIIMPWDSDMAITGPNEGVWYATDNGGPGGTARAIVRWETQESASGPTIAKVAVILTADGNIRFVYGDTVVQPTSGVTGYAPVKVGVGVGYPSVSKVSTPTGSYSNHDDILYTQTLGSRSEMSRVVFRLQQPIGAGATSTGQYFVYYGNPSPNLEADRDVKKVFDYVVDFKGAGNVVGQPAPDWDVQNGNTVTVENYQGLQVGVLRKGTQNHPRATVKDGAMPHFLNAEILAHIAPKGGGEREMAPMARVVSDPNDTFFQGGFAYATDSFGSNSAIVEYINPVTDEGPSLMVSTPGVLQADEFENVLFRTTGSPTLIQGKNWTDGEQEPAGWMLQANKGDFPSLTHGSTIDPDYTQAGTTGMSGYLQDIAMDYIALREMRDLDNTSGGAQTLTPAGPFIQGTISSSKASLNPLSTATVEITGTGGYDESFAVGPDGHFSVSLPAGTYTVKASAQYHQSQTVAGVSPTASGQTNIVLPYTGAVIEGVVRDVFTGQLYPGMTVVAVDSDGDWQGSAVTDSDGHYNMKIEDAGALSVAALSVGIDNNNPASGLGQRQAITVAPDTVTTLNFQAQPPINGDFEIPNQAGTVPLGWSTNPFTPGTPPGTYTLSTDQNHTPGGRYSAAVTNSTAQFEAWIPANFQWATVNPNANYTISVWVYFTQAGQRARLRVRTLDSTGADINVATPSGGQYITAGAPDATSGLQAPVGQWTKVDVTVAATPNLAKLDNRLYVAGPSGGGIATGTVYFDDYSYTATPVAQALGKLVDADGNPVSGAYVGPLVLDLVTGQNSVWQGPYSITDADGNFGIYPAQAGDVNIAAFILPPNQNGVLPDYGYVVDPTTGTLNASATPGARQTVRLLAAGNVADGAAASAQDALGNPMNGSGGGAITSAVDNNIATRWDSGGVASGGYPVVATFTLPQAEQVDQIELLWELADPSDITIAVDDGTSGFLPLVDQANAGSLGIPSGAINYSSYTEGTTDIIRFPTAQTVKAIQVSGRAPRQGLGNFSLIELRALSLANVPVIPISNADVTKALKIAGGILTATSGDITRLDTDADGKITVLDAAALRRSIP